MLYIDIKLYIGSCCQQLLGYIHISIESTKVEKSLAEAWDP